MSSVDYFCFYKLKGNYEMNTLNKFRRFILSMMGILPLILSFGISKPALAASFTSNISITLIADRNNVKMGKTITYTAIMTNHGPDNAGPVDVRFTLPPQLTLVSMTCEYGISPDTPFCEYSRLNTEETVVSTLTATPNLDWPTSERNLTVTADVLLEQDCAFEPDNCTSDPDLSNNLASVSTKLVGKLAHP
jgi:uncharacterized repeat protein (TIGR01451 family)